MPDPRPRNNQGMFAAQDTGGLDPQSMAQAYNPEVLAARKQGLLQRVGAALRGQKQEPVLAPASSSATEMDAVIAGRLKEFYRKDQPRHSRTRQYADPTEAWAKRQNLVNADGSEWKVSSPQLANSLWNQAKRGRMVVQRGVGLVGDAVAVAAGKPRDRDASGRVKKREWEKSWFRNAVVTAGIGTALGGGLIARRYARTNPNSPIGRTVRKAEAAVHVAKRKAEAAAGSILGGIDRALEPKEHWQRKNFHMNDESKKAIARLKEFAADPAARVVTAIRNEQDRRADGDRVLLPMLAGSAAGMLGAVKYTDHLNKRLGSGKYRAIPTKNLDKWERRAGALRAKGQRAANIGGVGILAGGIAGGLGLGLAWRKSAAAKREAKAKEVGLEATDRLRELAAKFSK